MGLKELLKAIGNEQINQQKQEKKLLEKIAALTSMEFAEQAAKALDSRKHLYGFEAYLNLLESLKTMLYGGVPEYTALDSVQSGCKAEEILALYNSAMGIVERF